MPADAIATFNPRHFFALAPEVVLALWGLIVLGADLGPFRRRSPTQRMHACGRLALLGALLALVVSALSVLIRFDISIAGFDVRSALNFSGIDYTSNQDPILLFGTIAGDLSTDVFNLLFTSMLVLVVWGSTVWGFTENWGEYFALLLWSTVGMMLLAASEELLTLFLTLEMMTICLYLLTAFEKDKRRSAEGGLKYFVYGSVSSALFLFGLSLIYGLTGTTQLHAIRDVLRPFGGGVGHVGLAGNVAGATAVLLLLVGFGFKVAAVPFHQWAPDAYEGAPAPVTAWIATGSKVASFVALMKVLLIALGPWSSAERSVATPGWIGLVAVISAASMTYGNLAALAQTNFKRMLAYSSIAHAGYMLVGVAAAGVSTKYSDASGAVLYYLVVYAFGNLGAFALASWLARDKGSDEIADLNGLAARSPILATCTLLLMLSLIGMPPLAGFFGKLYMFMLALNETIDGRLTLLWLVALGLLNSVVSAFYYVRVLQAMFLRPASGPPMRPAPTSVATTIVLATAVVLGFGIFPRPLMDVMKAAAVPMTSQGMGADLSGLSPPHFRLPAPTPDGPLPSNPFASDQPSASAPQTVTPPPPPRQAAPRPAEAGGSAPLKGSAKAQDAPKSK